MRKGGNEMKKLVSVSIVTLLLCGCMSSEEREKWQQQRVEAAFYREGVRYPGTCGQYASTHLLGPEDIFSVMQANRAQFIFGDLEYDDNIEIDFGARLSLSKQQFYNMWERGSSEEQVEARLACEAVVYGAMDRGYFMRGMTLKQVRVALQVPLNLRYSSLRRQTYSWDFYSFTSLYTGDGRIRLTFVDGRLEDWSRSYY